MRLRRIRLARDAQTARLYLERLCCAYAALLAYAPPAHTARERRADRASLLGAAMLRIRRTARLCAAGAYGS